MTKEKFDKEKDRLLKESDDSIYLELCLASVCYEVLIPEQREKVMDKFKEMYID